MHLGKLYSKFDSRCNSYNDRVREIKFHESNLKKWEFNYQTEVLLSDVWQSWCHFTRKLLMTSCRGATARDTTIIQARNTDNNSWQRIGYEARQASFNQNASLHGHRNFLIRREPTWGDLDRVSQIITGLGPSNASNLLGAYGSFSQLKDLQLVRNACAHKNIETLGSLSPLRSRYNFGTLKCATDIAWATTRGSNDFAIELWLYEMNMIADIATSKS